MNYFIFTLLLIAYAPLCGMQKPIQAYNVQKTQELKRLLNTHMLDKALPHIQIKQLVSDGADPNVRADESHYKGCSWFEALLLYSHSCERFWSTADYLYQKGASPNLHPRGLLASACYLGDSQRVLQLLKWDADIHAKNDKGETPLFSAIDGHIALSEFGVSSLQERELLIVILLENGAALDLKAPNADGVTPLVLARNNGLDSIQGLLQLY